MTQDEIERLTVLLHDGYPCGQIGCRETGERFAALVADVRRLRGLVEAAYSEGWHNGFAHERDEVLPYVRPEAETAWEKSDACREMEGA